MSVSKPTNLMSWEEFYQKTDNANKLMDRVWYCIACTDKAVGNQKIFWEHWSWKAGEESKSDLKAKKGENHTKTIEVGGKEVDYPIWPLRFSSEKDKEYFKMYPAIDLGCCVITPLAMRMQPVQFPTNDSRTEFRVDFCVVAGTLMYFVFTLDPHISEEAKKQGFDRLEAAHGVKREWFHDVKWPADYVIGSTGEPDINPK
mmetsp:Transcript_7040/g.8072  ORF Transcript_7040/g.8072 Transcript_7040/m.8072 type:complete len:201 (-) Transcript_7040:316-918(-)|eukprot:CAMPEP_0197861572 /NCGR_PEP_ID=MMETSP1438-20131217/37738_1 /TAXON_ID=1461541 /ORGANISM="Pterosperma sp., Strain CCMP1384" /LENGTH=200 /DNA_ID=CAMNT_0043478797 /DNA_START=148 /DNA_END=750 /DNA_ORIENTATION=+